jgi:hypothetical protein
MPIPAFDGVEPSFEHIFDVHVDLEAPQIVGATPSGTRQIFIVKGGTIDGPLLSGEVLPGGGDWALMRPDGCVQLDVRATLKADNSELIYSTYTGVIEDALKTAGRVFSGEDVPLSEYYFFTNPMFQTASEKYGWLNRVLSVGRGRIIAGGVQYRVWAIR